VDKEKLFDSPIPEVYDTEKIIDIHSSEADPSFDAEKVSEATKGEPHSKAPLNAASKNSSSKNRSNRTEGVPAL